MVQRSRGQSAMEYLMTYGWAILVVMVVVVVMWRMGFLGIGSSMPTTSDGFPTLKPILATCKMSEDVYKTGYRGLSCLFTSPPGAEIWVRGANVTVDGKYCFMNYIDVMPELIVGQSVGLKKLCANETLCDDWYDHYECFYAGGQVESCHLCGASGGMTYECLIMPPESTFSVNMITPGGPGPCWDIAPGRRYDAFVDITYDVNIGGKRITKHSSGHVRGTQE